MTPTLTTPRLNLAPLQLEDAEQVQLIFPQWEVVKYLANIVPWPFPSDGVFTYYRDIALPAVARGEAWYWTLRLRSDPDRIIGSISLELKPDEHRGFWIAPEHRRQGLMLEACNAVTDFWFNTLGQPVLRVPKAIANEASRRISMRQGMTMVRPETRDFVSGNLPSEIWEITREEWNANRATRVMTA